MAEDRAKMVDLAPPGTTDYKLPHEYDDQIDDDDYADGFCAYPGLDLDDMFGAFPEHNYGLPGGARTVDDFTPEGVEDRVRGQPISGALGGASGSKEPGKRYP